MADLDVMERDMQTMHGARPYVFTDLLRQDLDDIVNYLEKAGGTRLNVYFIPAVFASN